MKKINKLFLLTSLLCSGSSYLAQGQANDWIIPPSTHMHFSDCCNFVSTLPASSGINFCGSGPSYQWDQYAGVVSDANGNGIAFVNACGAYNPNTGANIGSSSSSPYSFAIPGLCNQYYSLRWSPVGVGGFRHQELFFRQQDGTNLAAITETNVISGYSNSTSTPIAIAPLETNGNRKVYVTNDLNQLISINVAPDGTVGAAVALATIPGGIWDMEVAPNKKKIVLNHSSYITVFDLVTNTESVPLGGTFPSTTKFSGIEYVPGTNSGDRVYFSYHQSPSALYFSVEGLGYVNLSAPTVLNDALAYIPSTLSKSGFGFTDIELGKNGYLYFAYHPGWGSHWLVNGNVGTLYSTYPNVPSFFVPVSPATTVSSIDLNNSGFIIQKQIDGEDYRNYTLSIPTFTVNGQSPNAQNITEITLCENDSLRLFTYETGYFSSYDISIEKGNIVGPNFTPGLGTYNANAIPGAKMRDTIVLNGGYASFLSGYSGGLKITYTVRNNCGTQSFTQIVNLKRIGLAVDFKLFGPSGCPVQNQVTNISQLANSSPYTQPATSVFCKDGWLGAFSAGIQQSTFTPTAGLTIQSYFLSVHQVDNNGDSIGPALGSLTQATPFNNYNFNSLIPGWFYTNYNTIKNNAYFKVTLGANTTPCGLIKRYSYFRIIDGGPGGNFWSKVQPGLLPGGQESESAQVFPNPAKGKINLSWYAAEHPESNARIQLSNTLGKTVLQQVLTQQEGHNEALVDVSRLAPGIYYYQLEAGGKIFKGKVTLL
ncbi:hypothetical protein DBR32_15600 [Taibaiella sp. KBW10]|uniref:T9SS type A sorting domain-containing protein n=1 Tax=Taibaiella sp. KBW10 TaxID=2153357 RepID=UPI000F594D41|nr:T9SS type A sorting domain-containing protein [Taibaiella sp. KBW10]RQO29680.1 hypothetical protein DBR32_15600 [Taibaiella sp. KBW10]